MSDLRQHALRFVRGPRILVLLAPFILLAPVWLSGKALYWGTPSTQFLPWWYQAWQSLRVGELPLWNPLLGAGAPLLANYQSALLYPPTWIYFLLAEVGGMPLMAWGMALLVAAHLAWAGLGMVLLVRRLGLGVLAQTVAGLAFGLSGYLVARSHFLSINAAAAWLPWILWAVHALITRPDNGRMLVLAAVLAMQWLAGHAQVAWYSLLLAVAWAVFWLWKQADLEDRKRAAGLLLGAALLALALSAAQLLPTLEYLLQSQRATDVGRDLALNYSFWPWRLLGLLAPNLFGNPAWGDFAGLGNYWEGAIYVGVLSFLLAICALVAGRKRPERRALRTFLLAVIGLAILLALGRFTPFFPWLYEHVPSFALFQAPARWMLWLVFALALLAAIGLEGWQRPAGRALYWSRLGVAAGAAVLLAVGTGWLLRAQLALTLPDSFLIAGTHLGIAVLAAAVLNLNAPQTQEGAARPWVWAVALLVAADLLLAGWGLNPGVDRAFYTQAAAARPELAPALENGRLYLPSTDEQTLKFGQLFSFTTFEIVGGPQALADSLLPNMTLMAGLPSANNFDPFVPRRYQAYVNAVAEAPADQQAGLLARLNVSLIQQADRPGEVNFEPLEALPRARWLPCAYIVEELETALALLGSGALDPAEEVVVEISDTLPSRGCNTGLQQGRASIVEQSANRVLVELDAPDGGWLLLADTYYPGWHAFVDGQEMPIYPADGLFRAVELPSGAHQVEFVYRPASLQGGAGLALLGLLLLIGFGIREVRTQSAAGVSGK